MLITRYATENTEWAGTLKNRELMDEEEQLYTLHADCGVYIRSRRVSEVFAEVTEGIVFRGPGRAHRERGVACLLNACFEALCHGRPDALVGVLWPTKTEMPRKNRYSVPRCFSRQAAKPVVEHLEQHGYITFHRGWKDAKGFKPGRASLVLPTDKLVALYDEVMEAGFEVVQTEHAERELVILKGGSGNREDYTDTPETNRNRERLQRMNAVNLSHCWRVKHPTQGCVPVHPSSLVLERQFNDGSLSVYGRLHCAAQGMPAVQRWTLTIDGEETTELDYRCMHIALAYAEIALWDSEDARASLVWPTDAYHVKGFTQATAKAAMMRLLNASSRDTAVLATMKLPSVSVHADAVRLLSRLEEKHAAIKDHFYGGGWKTLSLWEANIMCSILDRCIDSGVPLLPIHDGVVCRKSDREAVLDTMEQAVFREYHVMPIIAEVTNATGAKVNVSTAN